MKTMHLNLHKKWFDMILSGEKKEEYRELTKYWRKRFLKIRNNGIDNITFSNGYAKNRRQMVVQLEYISIRKGLVEWGAEKGEVYIICHLGEILSKKVLTCAECGTTESEQAIVDHTTELCNKEKWCIDCMRIIGNCISCDCDLRDIVTNYEDYEEDECPNCLANL